MSGREEGKEEKLGVEVGPRGQYDGVASPQASPHFLSSHPPPSAWP